MKTGRDVDTTGWHPYEPRKRPQPRRYVVVQYVRRFYTYEADKELRHGYTVCEIVDRKTGTAISNGESIEWKKWKGYGTCWAYLDELVVKN